MPTYRKHPDVVTRAIAGQTVLVPIRGKLEELQKLYLLDAVGEFLWQQLEPATDMKTLVAALVAEYEVEADVAEADVRRFIDDLAAAGLVMGEGDW